MGKTVRLLLGAILLLAAPRIAEAANEGDIISDQYGTSIYRNGQWEHYTGSSGSATTTSNSNSTSSSGGSTGSTATSGNPMQEYANLRNEQGTISLPDSFNNGAGGFDWSRWTSGTPSGTGTGTTGVGTGGTPFTFDSNAGDAIHRHLLENALTTLNQRALELRHMIDLLQEAGLDLFRQAVQANMAAAQSIVDQKMAAADQQLAGLKQEGAALNKQLQAAQAAVAAANEKMKEIMSKTDFDHAAASAALAEKEKAREVANDLQNKVDLNQAAQNNAETARKEINLTNEVNALANKSLESNPQQKAINEAMENLAQTEITVLSEARAVYAQMNGQNR